MMKAIGMLGLAGVAAAHTKEWFAMHDLTEETVEQLTKDGCYRGSYGDFMDTPTLHLLTCNREGAERIGEFHHTAFMCALELAHPELTTHVGNVVRERGNMTKIVYQSQQVTVIADFGDLTLLPDLCIESEFDDGAILNARYVPDHDFVPVRPPNPNNPAEKRLAAARSSNSKLEADPIIVDLLDEYLQTNVVNFLQDLSQREGTNDMITRNSYSNTRGTSSGGCANGDWQCASDSTDYVERQLNEIFREYPGEVTIERHQFRADMCDNVILMLKGESSDDMVVLGAHLDSRNTGSGATATGVAPGADDNGTGSAVLLEMARVIGSNPGVTFANDLHLEWYCGEEQGLLGSAALADRHVQRGDNIVGMFNNDMIGYTHTTGVTLAFMARNSNVALTSACKAIIATYVPDLPSGDTNACCSDQQSYHSRGFPAAGIFETTTNSVVYPEYHRVGDSFTNGLINFEQTWLFGKANLACSMEYAGPIARTL